MLKIIPLIIIPVFCFTSGIAQISPVQSSDGKSSLIITGGANVSFNFEDSKISASNYFPENSNNWDLSYHGSLKAVDGVSRIFSAGKFSPEGSLGLTSVWYFPSEDTDALGFLFVSFAQNVASLKLYNPGASDNDFVEKFSEKNSAVTIGYNKTNNSTITWGLAIRPTFSSNNYKSLDDFKISTQTLSFNSDSTTILSITSDEKELKGTFEDYESSFTEVDGMFDLLYWPEIFNGQLAIGGHLRANYSEIEKPILNSALGFYLTKAASEDQNPNAIVGGVVFESTDLFKKRTDDGFLDRCVVSIVVGYTFMIK